MFLEDLKELFFKIIKSRLLVMLVVFLLLFSILVQRAFYLQIVNGEDYRENFELTIQKERTLQGIRGLIYDKNGKVLAYNELAYSVQIEDNGEYRNDDEKNEAVNGTIYQLIQYIEGQGDNVVNDLSIISDGHGGFSYTVEGSKLRRFIADVFGKKSYDDLKDKQKNITAGDLFLHLKDTYGVSDEYQVDDQLKIMTVRFGMAQNSFKKYISTTVAKEVSNETVAIIMENLDSLQGVSVEEEYIRKYNDSEYFAHIIGYTGKISQDELTELQKENKKYDLNDIVGKSGIEEYMELDLQGTKGSETVLVDNLGKVVEIKEKTDVEAGSDVYLTIDADLQKAVYNIIEQKLAGILVSKIRVLKNYNPAAQKRSKDILIPADDVYFALLNNNVVDISRFGQDGCGEAEGSMGEKFNTRRNDVLEKITEELTGEGTAYKDLSKEMQVYIYYVSNMLANKGVINTSVIDKSDSVYKDWKNETVSLRAYLDQAIAKNWIDVSKLTIASTYSDSEQIYEGIVKFTEETLSQDEAFHKKIYNYMIKNGKITGREVCMALYEQGVLKDEDGSQYAALKRGSKGSYDFIINKISNLEITPAQLALDPCSASVAITNVKTGEVMALVTYPSYDNNRLANSIDADYYSQLLNDLSLPLVNRGTQQKTAPGSTFKLVSTIAGLEEYKISPGETITTRVTFDKVNPSPSCWSSSSHGSINAMQAIRHSCNYFFYEVGYRLSLDGSGKFIDKLGIQRITKYAEMLGLGAKSGIEIAESEPQIATEYPVTAAIGQSNHNYTNIGLTRYVTTVANRGTCYDLTLLDKVTDSDGNLIKDLNPEVRNQVDIADSSWNTVHAGMKAVADNTSAFNSLSIDIAGKTGTAEERKSRGNHALFLGFAPYENPEVALSVQIAYGYTSANAAEIASDVLKYYYKLEDPSVILNGNASAPTTNVAED